jgi:excisionase family DNA binding protein
MGTMFSPEQAAKRAGVSRRTVARALATRDLAGVRDNLQRWRIDSDAVDAWAVRRAPMGVATGHAMAYAQTGAHLDAEVVAERDQLRVDLAAARADNAGLRAEVAGVRELLAASWRGWRGRGGSDSWTRSGDGTGADEQRAGGDHGRGPRLGVSDQLADVLDEAEPPDLRAPPTGQSGPDSAADHAGRSA